MKKTLVHFEIAPDPYQRKHFSQSSKKDITYTGKKKKDCSRLVIGNKAGKMTVE